MRHNTARPDILTPDEPQPVEPLLIRQSDGFRFLAHLAPKIPSRFAAQTATIAYIAWRGPGEPNVWKYDDEGLTEETLSSVGCGLDVRMLKQTAVTHGLCVEKLAKILRPHVEVFNALLGEGIVHLWQRQGLGDFLI